MALRYWIIILVLGSAWGTSFLFNEILLREIGPLTVSFGRVALGAIGCWVYAFATKLRFKMTGQLALHMLIWGAINFAAPFAIYPISQQYIASGVAGIINAMMPIMVVIISHFWPGGENATVTKSFGVIFGFIGILILAVPEIQNGSQSEFWAILFTLCAPICYGIGLNYVRRFNQLDPSLVAALGLTGATVFIGPLAILSEGVPVITHMETYGAMAMIGIVLTSATFIVFYWLLPKVGATNISTITFIAPVSAVFLGVYFLGEEIHINHVLGMVAIFCGMLMIDGRLPRMLGRAKA